MAKKRAYEKITKKEVKAVKKKLIEDFKQNKFSNQKEFTEAINKLEKTIYLAIQNKVNKIIAKLGEL